MKKIILTGLAAGAILFVVSYSGLWLAIKCFPSVFVEYNNPLFNSDGKRDFLFYSHAFVISMALSWFWDRFKSSLTGHFMVRGLEFGLIYGIVALIPVMWITFSSLDITLAIVFSWFVYGLLQACIAGGIFAKLNP